ncbi:MAG: rod shape-determining protein MreC, partial [Deltaproteobacteria bacterium]|nr:rod shape-determining protein MreC [Deltaproteobacteria bacterium]
MSPLVRRYREPIFVIFCIALPLAVLFARGRKVADPTIAERALISLTAPLEHTLVWMVGGLGDAWSNWVWLRGVRQENLELKRLTFRQGAEAQRLDELMQENARLRGLLDFSSQLTPLKLLPAAVVAVGASPHSHTLRIARGSNDGIKRGNAVISPAGVVGKVEQVVGGYADVVLMIGAQSAVPALSARTRVRATVKGTGDPNKASLEYVPRTDDMQDGDSLVTAGGLGFPKGLLIGKVANLQRKPTGMFVTADVIPAVAFETLDEVLVVLDEGEPPLTPPPGISPTTPGAPGQPPLTPPPATQDALPAPVAP